MTDDRIARILAPGNTQTRAQIAETKRKPLGPLTARRTLRRESGKMRFRRVTREASCAEQIAPLPDEGQELVTIMTGNFHGWDLVGAVLQLSAPACIDALHVATLGFNKRQAIHLGDLIDADQVGACIMVVSEYFAQSCTAEYAALWDVLTQRDQTCARSRNHAKILCFAMSDGARYVAHGSMNLRSCNNYEQLVLANSPDLYAFFVEYIESLAAAQGAIVAPEPKG
jgi:hypothetical protein